MDYSEFEPDYPHRAFKDHRKKKCGGERGKAHKNVVTPGDCDWRMVSYWWMSREVWGWDCRCTKKCKNCGLVSRIYGRCANKKFKELLRPEGVETKW